MTSVKQLEANRRNARRSTGPKTAPGKAIARLNALKHGATAATLIVPGLEEPADWEAHREGILASLTPRGRLETVLAERVAGLLWRLGRVARYEAAAIQNEREAAVVGGPWHEYETSRGYFSGVEIRSQLEQARSNVAALEQFVGLRDADGMIGDANTQVMMLVEESLDEPPPFEVGDVLPEDLDPSELASWSVRDLRRAISAVAGAAGLTADRLVGAAAAREQAWLAELDQIVTERVDMVDYLVREHILPDPYKLDKIARHETHLSRQLHQALDELRRLQTARAIDAPSRPVGADGRDDEQD